MAFPMRDVARPSPPDRLLAKGMIDSYTAVGEVGSDPPIVRCAEHPAV
jgi:hypothetical protein